MMLLSADPSLCVRNTVSFKCWLGACNEAYGSDDTQSKEALLEWMCTITDRELRLYIAYGTDRAHHVINPDKHSLIRDLMWRLAQDADPEIAVTALDSIIGQGRADDIGSICNDTTFGYSSRSEELSSTSLLRRSSS